MKSHKRKKKPESYCKRTYRQLMSQAGMVTTQVRIKETDLHILAEQGVAEQATDLVLQYRNQLEGYIVKYPQFSATLDPLPQDKTAPPLVRDMLSAGIQAGVGPMAAVAGGIAEYVGKGLMAQGIKEVMVENGGDIFLQRSCACSVAIFAGESPLSYKVGLRVDPSQMPLGICTSSGTVGHSLSLGEADSVTVLARSTLLADAAATRLGNEVGAVKGGEAGVARALDMLKKIPGIIGVVVICGELMGATGDVELVRIDL
ncbi:MAG: UPF0280 family protein [Proteobacteria bacterium]|nr:UPF0280 family protein [Pseudomonadota bacterium]MBU1060262.1 UPF0280 family protein [Pseudomonadota bacterium]